MVNEMLLFKLNLKVWTSVANEMFYFQSFILYVDKHFRAFEFSSGLDLINVTPGLQKRGTDSGKFNKWWVYWQGTNYTDTVN